MVMKGLMGLDLEQLNAVGTNLFFLPYFLV